MPYVTPGQVHNKTLIKVGLLYKNPGYAADEVFPIVPVANETDYYISWDKGDWLRDEARMRAPGTAAHTIQAKPTLTNTYQCEEYAIASNIPTRLSRNADSQVKLQATWTELLTDKIQLAREIRVAAMCNTSSNWTGSTTLTGTDQWSDYNTSDPIGDIDTACASVEDNSVGRMANKMVIGVESWRKLRRHPDIVRACYGEGSNEKLNVTPARLAAYFELEKIIVGRAQKTTVKEGISTDAASKVWGDYCFVCHAPNSAAGLEPSAGYLFRNFYRVRSWFDQRADSALIEVSECIDEKVISADCGYLISDTVA